MKRTYLRPGWVIAHVVVVALGIVFVLLGLWQLDRLEQRRLSNETGESRFTEEPTDLRIMLDSVGRDVESLEYRRALATGVFDPRGEVLIRSQVHLGTAGFHVITPLVGESGDAVMVNRGWIPLGLDEVPAADAPPPSGQVTIEGWIHLSQERPALGPEDPPEGQLVHMNRVDLVRIQQQVDFPLLPAYLVSTETGGSELPIPAETPEFDEEGPHLAYAVQWFGFALVLAVGWFFFVRRQTTRASSSTTS